MKRSLIILALLASPVYAKDHSVVQPGRGNGDYIPPKDYSDPRPTPEWGHGFWNDALSFIVLNFGDNNDYLSSTNPPKYEQERLYNEQQQTGQIYKKPDPVICQWEPEPNAVVCHR